MCQGSHATWEVGRWIKRGGRYLGPEKGMTGCEKRQVSPTGSDRSQ